MRSRVWALAVGLALGSTQSMAAPPAAAKPGESGASESSSQPSRAECLAAHHSAQELKQKDMLVEAQQKLLICASGTCPGAIIADCGNWMSDLEQRTPSMVLEIKVDGNPTDDVKVFVDQAQVADWSHALKINPGRHVVRVETPHFDANEQSVMVPEGQHMRLVSVEFKSATPVTVGSSTVLSTKPDVPSRDMGAGSRPVPGAVYPLVGVGVAGLAAFGVFAALGKSKQSDLEGTCQGHCTDSDLSPMKTSYLIGDISGAVGVASLIGAAIVYFSRPTRTTSSLSIDVGPVGASAAGSWGGSVKTTW
jgi:hypothetical protein